ncbi:unnamed protein product [Closterium sp. NIES-53]
MVAVKRRDDDSLQGDREFVNEVDLLSRACHPNLVELVGYCRYLYCLHTVLRWRTTCTDAYMHVHKKCGGIYG